jgi:hypothetical protein
MRNVTIENLLTDLSFAAWNHASIRDGGVGGVGFQTGGLTPVTSMPPVY